MDNNAFTQNVPGANPANMEAKKPEERVSSVNIWMILTAIFAVLAIGGVVFGVVMMKNSGQKEEDLSAQVDELESRNSELLNQLIEEIDDTGSAQIIPVVMTPSEYLYVGEWGIKIKKPENWQSIIKEYSFYNDRSILEIKENPEVPTSHALIVKKGKVSCDGLDVQYDACFVVREDAYIVTDLPSAGAGGVSEEFRNFVLNTNNYLVI